MSMLRLGVCMALLLAAGPLPAAGEPATPQPEQARLVELVRDWNGRAFCAPRGAPFQDLLDTRAAFLLAHPELGDQLNDEQTLRSLAQGFPCDPAGMPTRGADARLRRAFRDASAPLLLSVPAFGQTLALSFPAGFAAAPVQHADGADGHYLRAHVLVGDNAADWNERISIAVEQGLARRKDLTPQRVVADFVAAYQGACPESFVVSKVPVAPVSGFEAYAAVASCGTMPETGGRSSQSEVMLAIRGQEDVYAIRWAERGEPWSNPSGIDVQHWQDKFKRLAPIRLCALQAATSSREAGCPALP